MGTVIKFPRTRRRPETAIAPAGVSADIIILPVVRIERTLGASPGVKARTARSGSDEGTKAASKSVAKSASKIPATKPPAKSASLRKRSKRATLPALTSPERGRALPGY